MEESRPNDANPYFPPQHELSGSKPDLPATRRELVWRCAKLGAKTAFWTLSGLLSVGWIVVAGAAIYVSVRNGVSPIVVVNKMGGPIQVLLQFGMSILLIIMATFFCGVAGAVIGLVASVFRRNIRSADDATD